MPYIPEVGALSPGLYGPFLAILCHLLSELVLSIQSILFTTTQIKKGTDSSFVTESVPLSSVSILQHGGDKNNKYRSTTGSTMTPPQPPPNMVEAHARFFPINSDFFSPAPLREPSLDLDLLLARLAVCEYKAGRVP